MIRIFENDAKEKDLESINKLLKILNPDLKTVDFEEVLAVMKGGFIFLARDIEKNGELIGMATLIPMAKLAGIFGDVEDVVVLPEYRGQKIGKRLMEEIIKKAKELKLEYLFLTSSEKREVARKMYQSFGFQEYNTTPFKLFLDKIR